MEKDWEARFTPPKTRLSAFQCFLLLSIVVAIANVALVVLPLAHQIDLDMWKISISLTVFWLFLLVAALIQFKKRGLWLLVGAPFALYLPFVFVMMIWACAHNHDACP